jgi:hypothetical protein
VLLQELGQNFSQPEKARPLIKKLLNKWIDFDNEFGLNPPLWARKDKNWTQKVHDLADVLGMVQKNYVPDQNLAHINVIKFSRRLTYLYEYRPMPERAKFLLNFPRLFDGIWSGYYDDDLELLRKNAAELADKSFELPDYMPEQIKSMVNDFIYKAEQINRLAAQPGACNSNALYTVLSVAEDDFSLLNEKLNSFKNEDVKK